MFVDDVQFYFVRDWVEHDHVDVVEVLLHVEVGCDVVVCEDPYVVFGGFVVGFGGEPFGACRFDGEVFVAFGCLCCFVG